MADGSLTNLCRINLNETLDPSFQPTLAGTVRNLRVAPDKWLFVELMDYNFSLERERRTVVHLTADGTKRSSFEMTFPGGTWNQTAILDDGSIVLSEDGGQRLRHIFSDGSSRRREGIGFWSSFWEVRDLIPLAGGELVILQRAACDAGPCWAQDWLKILPSEGSGGQMVTWMPPAPVYGGTPMLLVDAMLNSRLTSPEPPRESSQADRPPAQFFIGLNRPPRAEIAHVMPNEA
jgi:hypothetical protein